jgi:hypothetical protein
MPVVSAARVTKRDDSAMDVDSHKKPAPAPLSVRYGPVDDSAKVNGNGKRKSRASLGNKINYKDESDSDDGPLVGLLKQSQLPLVISTADLVPSPGQTTKENGGSRGLG